LGVSPPEQTEYHLPRRGGTPQIKADCNRSGAHTYHDGMMGSARSNETDDLRLTAKPLRQQRLRE
jgi:hypothetical protein